MYTTKVISVDSEEWQSTQLKRSILMECLEKGIYLTIDFGKHGFSIDGICDQLSFPKCILDPQTYA
jgi:hypothetical protein